MGERTLTVPVEGIGTFVFKKRTLAMQLQIEGAAERATGGPVQDKALDQLATTIAALQVLTVTAPEGWDLDGIDPLDAEEMGRVLLVHRGLREAERTFRRGAAA